MTLTFEAIDGRARMALGALAGVLAGVMLVAMLAAPGFDGGVTGALADELATTTGDQGDGAAAGPAAASSNVRTGAPGTASLEPLTAEREDELRGGVVTFAASQVGVQETLGENRGPHINMYRQATISVGESPTAAEPWCADFVSWAWARAGHPIGFDGKGSDYVPQLALWARMTGRWRAADTYQPRPGDLAVMFGEAGPEGHVALVGSVLADEGQIITIEGNWQDQVTRRKMPRDHARIDGYIEVVRAGWTV